MKNTKMCACIRKNLTTLVMFTFYLLVIHAVAYFYPKTIEWILSNRADSYKIIHKTIIFLLCSFARIGAHITLPLMKRSPELAAFTFFYVSVASKESIF